MNIDPNKPVHIVFAAPWQSVARDHGAHSDDHTWWTFPDDVADGDTVITVVEAREPAVTTVSVLRMGSDDDWDLTPADPRLPDAIAAAAIERRTEIGFSAEGRLWGCTGCDREWEDGFRPRFQRHVGPEWPFDEAEPVVVCPSCHDILHQPLGPSVNDLMFSNRPACPECHEHRTFKQINGMPPGPPPYGTVGGGCVVTGMEGQFRCGSCSHEW